MGKSKKKSKKHDKKKHYKHKVHKTKHKSKRKIKEIVGQTTESDTVNQPLDDDDDFAVPLDLMNNKSHAPETPEEFAERSNKLRKEVDPITGRTRLIRGDSEILEEIVSKDRHKDINKLATQSDGRYFQENTTGKHNFR